MAHCPTCGRVPSMPHHYVTEGLKEKAHYHCTKCGKWWTQKYKLI